jgi:hypothetical protein
LNLIINKNIILLGYNLMLLILNNEKK